MKPFEKVGFPVGAQRAAALFGWCTSHHFREIHTFFMD
jgi:hypothetical protein